MNTLRRKYIAISLVVGVLLFGGLLLSTATRLGVSVPTIVALFETTLQDSITSSATTMTLVSGTDADGTTLSGTYGFIIDEGTSRQEFVVASCTNTACSSMLRGISVIDGATEKTALQQKHRKGSSVKISNHPQLARLSRILNGDVSYPNTLFMETANGASASSTELMSKDYIDNLANQGASTSTESLGGISQLATQLQMASSTDLGTDIPLVLQAKYATSTPQVNGLYTPISQNNGYLHQGWWDLTQTYAWTGVHSWGGGGCTSTTTAVAYGTPTTTQSTTADGHSSTETYTTGWRPKNIEVDYYIQGHENQDSGDYIKRRGTAYYDTNGTLLWTDHFNCTEDTNQSTCDLDSGASASGVGVSFTSTDDMSPGDPTDGNGNDAIQMTLSVSSVTDTGYSINCITQTSVAPSTNTAYCSWATRAFR